MCITNFKTMLTLVTKLIKDMNVSIKEAKNFINNF
ncbi:MAG: DUF2959 domain-containing protein [Proteobacteria bacterium]|nr:DUF2959 domain-containing protein [Pseudomonadota bacterium]